MDLINSFSYFIHYEGKNINRIPPSKIEFHHLTFVLKGSFTYYVEGQKIELKENDAMLLAPGTMRERVFS